MCLLFGAYNYPHDHLVSTTYLLEVYIVLPLPENTLLRLLTRFFLHRKPVYDGHFWRSREQGRRVDKATWAVERRGVETANCNISVVY